MFRSARVFDYLSPPNPLRTKLYAALGLGSRVFPVKGLSEVSSKTVKKFLHWPVSNIYLFFLCTDQESSMFVPKIFKALALSVAIASVSVVGFGATRSAIEAYEKAEQVVISMQEGKYFKAPASDADVDLSVMAPKFIVAFVLGKNAIKLPRQVHDYNPLGKLTSLLSSCEYAIKKSISDDGLVHVLVIRVPDTMWDIEQTIHSVRSHALVYAIDDGSGYFSSANTFRALSKG